MGDRSKFDGDNRRDPKTRDDVRLDGTKRPRTHLGFPTPPPTPGSEVAFPTDEVTRRTPIPAQLVDALKPSKPPARETTQPFAADMPVPPPATGRTLPPGGVTAQPVNPRRTMLGGHASPDQRAVTTSPPPPPAAEAPTNVSAQPRKPSHSPGPSLRLDPSDFGKAPTQPMPSASVRPASAPRLQLDETSTHTLEAPAASSPSGPQLQLEASDHLEGPSSRRSGGRGVLVAIILLALAGGAAFAYQQRGNLSSGTNGTPQADLTPVDPPSDPSLPGASATAEPAESAPEAAESDPRPTAVPTGGADSEEVAAAAEAARESEAAREAEAAAARKARLKREADAREAAAAKRRKAAAQRAAARQTRKASKARVPDVPTAADAPEASSSLEEARRALQELGSGSDGVLEVRPTDDAPPSPEPTEDYDDLPPPPPPPPSSLSGDDSFDEPY